MKFIDWNARYWNKGSDKGDCVIRALCSTTLYGYKYLCDALGGKFVMGSGYTGGFTIEEIDEFAAKTGIIVKIMDKNMFTDDDVVLSFADLKLLQETAARAGVRKTASFMFGIKSDVAGTRWQHATAFIKNGNDLQHVDVAACEDSIFEVPMSVWAVPYDKICPKDSPNRYENERKRILEQWRREVKSALTKGRK